MISQEEVLRVLEPFAECYESLKRNGYLPQVLWGFPPDRFPVGAGSIGSLLDSSVLESAAALASRLKEQGSGEWRSMESAPRDGTEVLLRTNIGVVSAWFQPSEKHETVNGPEWDGAMWVCYDDAFQIEVEEPPSGYIDAGVLGWQPLPAAPQPAPQRERAISRHERDGKVVITSVAETGKLRTRTYAKGEEPTIDIGDPREAAEVPQPAPQEERCPEERSPFESQMREPWLEKSKQADKAMERLRESIALSTMPQVDRAAIIEECAGIAEKHYSAPGWHSYFSEAGRSIAAAIHALKEERK